MNSVREEDIRKIINLIPYRMCENSTFLITGANGFLASYMVDTLMLLNREGFVENCKVIALCRNRKKAEHIFREWMECENFHLVIQSVEKKIEVDECVDYVIHAASCSTTHMFETCPVDLLAANVIGSYNMLELSKEKKVKGFLFFSSGAVYGDADCDELKEDETYVLDYLKMKNSYASSKRMGEILCKAYWQQYQVPAKAVRISHTYGPGIDINDGHVYSDFAKNIVERKDLLIKGDGMTSRPFCYVTDAVCAFWLILFRGENGQMYNMANADETFSIKELADILVQRAFKERKLKVILTQKENTECSKKIKVNVQKLERLGWHPSIDVTEGFRRLVASIEEEMRNS
ncbi:MAG: NAD(P)-dependent oxidoreductase [Lachnospiraceae bacterium]|nr:NAD(P)-dependent oxidoreductase [Lachnospiraceae bacterium]